MRRDNLKVTVKIDDFVTVLNTKKNQEIQSAERYKTFYKKNSSKKFKQTASKLRKIADSIERGVIPQEVRKEERSHNRISLVIPVNLMKYPYIVNTDSTDSLIKALKISSSKTISLDKWEYENYFS